MQALEQHFRSAREVQDASVRNLHEGVVRAALGTPSSWLPAVLSLMLLCHVLSYHVPCAHYVTKCCISEFTLPS